MQFSTRLRKVGTLTAAGALAAAGLVSAAAPASAAGITGIHVSKVTATSFTVTLKSVGTGWKYKLYASRTRSDIYFANLKRAPYQSSLASKPVVTLSKLPYGNGTYYWRLQAIKSSYRHTSAQYSVGLVPATPAGVTVTTQPNAGTWLTWSSRAVSGFQIQQVDAAGHSRTYSTSGGGHQFTPLGLTRGATYSFRMRAVNVSTPSPWTAFQQTTAQSDQQSVRVMTYNLLTADSAGQSEGGTTVPAWAPGRGNAAAAAILAVHPDVIGLQEGAAWIGSKCDYQQRGTRQADDLLSRLRASEPSGVSYALAHTEVPPCMKEGDTIWFRTGDYIIYDNAKYAPLGTAGAFDIGAIPSSSGIGTARYAAYQILQNRVSGAKFLYVVPHLFIGSGSSADKLRYQETQSMIQQSRSYASNNGGMPIVYSGDMNSNELHNPDGPEVATRAVNVADAKLVAVSRTNANYNSANGYMRKPPADGHSIDHVFTEPGVGVASWGLYLHLDSSHRFIGTIPSDHNPLWADLSIPF